MHRKTNYIQKTGNILLLIMVCALAILFPFSWIGESIGLPFNNMLTGEGIRYFLSTLPLSCSTHMMSLTISLIICISTWKESGFGKQILYNINHQTGIKPTFRQRQAFNIALTLLCIYFFTMVCMSIGNNAVLLNIKGELLPSEQMMGIILSTLITLTFVSLLYGIMSHQLRGWNNIISSLYTGFGTYGVWILVVMTATLLYDTILFALIPL